MCTSASERATAGERGGDDGGRLMKTRTENLGPKEHEGAWHGDQYRIHYTRHGAEHWLSRPFSCMFLSRQVSYLPVPTIPCYLRTRRYGTYQHIHRTSFLGAATNNNNHRT